MTNDRPRHLNRPNPDLADRPPDEPGNRRCLAMGVLMNGNPKMFPPEPGINAPRTEWIDINAMDETDPVHFRQRPKLTADEFDDNQFSIENGDGEIY